MATIVDVAQLAGVSISTVSLALNFPERVSETTKGKIFQAMQDLGYEPATRRAGARSGMPKRKTVVFISPPLTGPFFFEIMRGIRDGLALNHLDMLFLCYYEQNEEERNTLLKNVILNANYLGAICLCADISDENVTMAVTSKFPIVFCSCDRFYPELSNVTVDENQIGALAARHLLSLNYRRIGIIGDADVTRLKRYNAFVHTLEASGIRLQDEMKLSGSYIKSSGVAAIERLLQNNRKLPEALFCMNDDMAIGAISALKAHGIIVGQQIGIVGCDNAVESMYVQPALTTVYVPQYDQGMIVSNIMARQIAHFAPEQVEMAVKLLLRDSCGSKHKKMAPAK